MLKANNIGVVRVILAVGVLYLCIDFIRFAQLTPGNLVWLSLFALGIALVFMLNTLLVFWLRKETY